MPDDPVRVRGRGCGSRPLDLETLPGNVRAAVEAMVAGAEVTLRREGRDVGVLVFHPGVLEGTVVVGPSVVAAQCATPEVAPDGVTVVAVATQLSDAARGRLSDELGPDYIVLDLLQAPPTADVVLTHPVSPQLLGALRAGYPNARVIVTEFDDEEFGLGQAGPVGRLLDAGASAYLPPGALREIASGVHAHLTGSAAAQLTAAAAAKPFTEALPSSPNHQAE